MDGGDIQSASNFIATVQYETDCNYIILNKNYTSKSLKDFIYESNKGNDIIFWPDENQALKKLSKAVIK